MTMDADPGFEALLRHAWEVGREAWPNLPLPPGVFTSHLLERLPGVSTQTSLAPLLEKLVLPDLFLACACVHQVAGAVETLERHYLAELPTALAYLKQPIAFLEDVCQQVRIHLLVGTSEVGPRLAEYSGRGTLLSWIRVIAVRMALRQGSPAREAATENLLAALEAIPATGSDAELDLIKRHSRHEFRQAVREAFSSLAAEQRNLIRLHFIEELSTTEMAPLFQVNQSTISRRLKSARQAIFDETKRLLQERLGLSTQEFHSLLHVIDSQLDISLGQVLDDKG